MLRILWKNYVFAFLFCIAILSSSATRSFAQEGCTNASLYGQYGFSVKGTNVALGVPYAIVGRFVPDGQGNFTGTGTQSVAGIIASFSFDGTYEINADCTGSAAFMFPGGGTSKLIFILVQGGNEIFIMDTDQGSVETGIAKKQSRHGARHVSRPR